MLLAFIALWRWLQAQHPARWSRWYYIASLQSAYTFMHGIERMYDFLMLPPTREYLQCGIASTPLPASCRLEVLHLIDGNPLVRIFCVSSLKDSQDHSGKQTRIQDLYSRRLVISSSSGLVVFSFPWQRTQEIRKRYAPLVE